MSLRSMTGHGYAIAQAGGIRVTANLSSVNRRQLDVAISLPRPFSVWEPRITDLVAEYVSRGRVAGAVDVTWTAVVRKSTAKVDEALAAGYIAALRRTARALHLRDDLSASLLTRLPEVVNCDESSVRMERVWAVVEQAVRKAMRKLVTAREREGRHLQRDIVQRIKKIEQHLSAVRRRAPQVSRRYREELSARLREAGVSAKQEDDRLLREVVLFADRVDIAEELSRLESHIAQFREVMRGSEAAGRTLDFLLQEMGREINTLGAKANDIAISRHVVMLKTELEKIREQVQNVE